MRQTLATVLARQAGAAAFFIGLIGFAAALGVIALGCVAYAVYQHLLPALGPAVAAWISAAIFLAAAALIAALAWLRLRRALAVAVPEPPPEPRRAQGAGPGPEPRPGAGPAAPDLALALAGVVRDQLPKHAVPAALLALVAGIVVGLNPRAAQSLVEILTRKTP